jgi:hypothetical protein
MDRNNDWAKEVHVDTCAPATLREACRPTGKAIISATITDEPRALRNAAFASLLGYPATKAAKRLVDDVYARVAADQREHAQTAANENKLRNAVGAFLADLLVAHSGKRPAHWVYRSMSPRNFTGASVGHSVFVERMVPTLERLGLVRRQKSVAHYGTGFGVGAKTVRGRQWATRFRAQTALLDLSIRQRSA